jgi:hypothetical protein
MIPAPSSTYMPAAEAARARQSEPGRDFRPIVLIVEAALLLAILAVSLALRLMDLEGPRSSFPDLFDEGIRSEQLLLMANGFRPFRDIYTAQGLLLLDFLYPFYALFGGSLGAIRLGVGLLSMLGLVGAWWTGRQAAGAVGGVAAAFLLGASPAYLEGSRLALAEVPSLAPCIWAIGCGLRWGRGGRVGWLCAAAVLATVGLLVKPMAVAVAAPLGLFVLLRPARRPRHVALALGLALGITALAILIMGPADVYQQIVQYRVGARQGASWDLRRNLKFVLGDPFRGQPGLFILAALGSLLLLRADWRRGLALASWPLVAIGMLLAYSPLHPKHLVYLYPPLTLVAGAGLGRIARMEGPAGRPARLLAVGIAVILAAVPVAAVPNTFDDPLRDSELEDPDLHVFDGDAYRSIDLLTGPRDFILTDHPYIAALARRMVPPNLVDPSRGRTRAGVLSDRDAIDAAEQYDVRLVLIWADRLRRLPGIPPWLDKNYVLSQVFGGRSVKIPRGAKDRSIYLRRDVDLDAARASLESTLTIRETVDYERQLRLLGASVSADSVAPQQQFTLTVGWLALAPMATDYHVTVHLVGPKGELRAAQEHDLEGGGQGTSIWQPGRWLFRSFAIRADPGTRAGEYAVQLALVDPRTGREIEPAVTSGATHYRVDRPGTLTIATIRVQ